MGLFKPAWMSRRLKKARAAVEKISDPNKLKKIALQRANDEIGALAVSRLTDEADIVEIAFQFGSKSKAAAIYRLRDEARLKELLETQGDILPSGCWLAAAEKIGDQEFLARMVEKSKQSSDVRKRAIALIPSPVVLMSLAKELTSAVLIEACVRRLAAYPEMLKSLALGQENRDLRNIAIRTITDYAFLHDIAVNAEQEETCLVAARRLRELKKQIPKEWWEKYVEGRIENLKTDRLAREAGEGSKEATKELADEIQSKCVSVDLYRGQFTINRQALREFAPLCSFGVIERLEEKVKTGNTGAAVLLRALYGSTDINRELRTHADGQKHRFCQYHIDRQVDSDVCGQTFRHSDMLDGESISPLT